MATSEVNAINGSTTFYALTKDEIDTITKISPIVDDLLKLSPSLMQKLEDYDFSDFFIPDPEDAAYWKISTQARFLLHTVNGAENPPLLNFICYKWISYLQNKVNEEFLEHKARTILELEQVKTHLEPLYPEGFTLYVKPYKGKPFKPTQELQKQSKIYKKHPSISVLRSFWEELWPSLLKRLHLRIESECKDFTLFNKRYSKWPFELLYEILYFRRDMLCRTPEHVRTQAAAADLIWKRLLKLIKEPSEETINAFVLAWWNFGLFELDYPPVTKQAFQKYPALNLNLQPVDLSLDVRICTDEQPVDLFPDTRSCIDELKLLAYELEDFRAGRFIMTEEQFKTTLDATTRCGTTFFQLCIKYVSPLNIDTFMHEGDLFIDIFSLEEDFFDGRFPLEGQLFHDLILAYFIYFSTPKRLPEKSPITPFYEVAPLYLKAYGVNLEKCTLQLQTLSTKAVNKLLRKSILEFLYSFLDLLDQIPDREDKEAISRYKANISLVLHTMEEALLDKEKMQKNSYLSEVLRQSLGLIEIQSTDPTLKKYGESFAKDITPLLNRTGPYKNLGPTIPKHARMQIEIIRSKVGNGLTREDLKQLAYMWLEGTRISLIQNSSFLQQQERIRIFKQLLLQLRICMPDMTEETLPKAMIAGCPYSIYLTAVENGHIISSDTPFLFLIEKALSYLFKNKPIASTNPEVSQCLRSFPYNFSGFAEAHSEHFVPLIAKMQNTLVEYKNASLTPKQEHEVYKYLGTINELWLLKLIESIEELPKEQAYETLKRYYDEHGEHCRQTVFVKLFDPENDFSDLRALTAFAKRAQEESPEKYLKFLCTKLGAFCTSRLGKIQLATYLPEIQEKLDICQNFDPALMQQAYNQRFILKQNEARYLINSFEHLLKLIAEEQTEFGDAPRHFVEAWMRFGMKTTQINIEEFLELEMPIITKPPLSFFEHYVSRCPEKPHHHLTNFTPENLQRAFEPKLSQAIDQLLKDIPTDQALQAPEQEWLAPAPLTPFVQQANLPKLSQAIDQLLKDNSTDQTPQQECLAPAPLTPFVQQASSLEFIQAIDKLLKDGPTDQALQAMEQAWLLSAPLTHFVQQANPPEKYLQSLSLKLMAFCLPHLEETYPPEIQKQLKSPDLSLMQKAYDQKSSNEASALVTSFENLLKLIAEEQTELADAPKHFVEAWITFSKKITPTITEEAPEPPTTTQTIPDKVTESETSTPAQTISEKSIEPKIPAPTQAPTEEIPESEPPTITQTNTDEITEPETSAPTQTISEEALEPKTPTTIQAITEKIPDPEPLTITQTDTDEVTKPEAPTPTQANPEEAPESSTTDQTNTKEVTKPETSAPEQANTKEVTKPEISAPKQANPEEVTKPEISAPAQVNTEKVPESHTTDQTNAEEVTEPESPAPAQAISKETFEPEASTIAQPDLSFFEDCISQCPEKTKHAHAGFTAENLLQAYQSHMRLTQLNDRLQAIHQELKQSLLNNKNLDKSLEILIQSLNHLPKNAFPDRQTLVKSKEKLNLILSQFHEFNFFNQKIPFMTQEAFSSSFNDLFNNSTSSEEAVFKILNKLIQSLNEGSSKKNKLFLPSDKPILFNKQLSENASAYQAILLILLNELFYSVQLSLNGNQTSISPDKLIDSIDHLLKYDPSKENAFYISSGKFFHAVKQLLENGPSDTETLLTMQLEWFYSAPAWKTQSFNPSEESVLIAKKLKNARKRLRNKIENLK